MFLLTEKPKWFFPCPPGRQSESLSFRSPSVPCWLWRRLLLMKSASVAFPVRSACLPRYDISPVRAAASVAQPGGKPLLAGDLRCWQFPATLSCLSMAVVLHLGCLFRACSREQHPAPSWCRSAAGAVLGAHGADTLPPECLASPQPPQPGPCSWALGVS